MWPDLDALTAALAERLAGPLDMDSVAREELEAFLYAAIADYERALLRAACAARSSAEPASTEPEPEPARRTRRTQPGQYRLAPDGGYTFTPARNG